MINNIIILAAGKGTRMKTSLPKCAVKIIDKSFIEHIIATCKKINIGNIVDICNIIVIVGYKKEIIINLLDKDIKYVVQKEQLGTGHAVRIATLYLENCEGNTLILPGDMPLITSKQLLSLCAYHEENNNDMTILSSLFVNPYGYGRIVRDTFKLVVDIIEESEASIDIRKIKEVNTGVYIIKTKVLIANIDKIDNNNAKNEYYLTDIVKILSQNYKVDAFMVEYDYHLMGINDLDTLYEIENIVKNNKENI